MHKNHKEVSCVNYNMKNEKNLISYGIQTMELFPQS